MNAGIMMVSVIAKLRSQRSVFCETCGEKLRCISAGPLVEDTWVYCDPWWPPVVMSYVSIIMHPGIITPVVTPATMAIKGLDNWHDFQFQCPAASISPGFCLRVLFSFLLFHCFDLESGAGHSGHYRAIHNYNQTFCSIKIWSVHEMGLDGTRGCVRSGRDHNYYLYQTKLPAWLPSAQHSTHFLETREVREREDDNGPGNVPSLPRLIIHSGQPSWHQTKYGDRQ